MALDWVIHPQPDKVRDVIVCIPGLSGDSKELYCITLAKECLLSDLDLVIANYRGTSNVDLKVTFFLFICLDSEDFQRW